MNIPTRPAERLEFYRKHLLQEVMPFWPKYALDSQSGALLTCIDDDGTVGSEDIYMWSQLRAMYSFSAMYRRIDRNEQWLDIARGLFEFCRRFGRDEAGRWCFRLRKTGEQLEGASSIYADGFALFGLTEYFLATGDEDALTLAMETYESVRSRLAVSGSYQTAPYPIPPGAKAHAISMVFSFAFDGLGRAADRPDIVAAALDHAEQVMTCFRRADSGLILEYVKLDGSIYDGPKGRIVLPGHAIECMWFLIHIYHLHGRDDRIAEATETIRRHLEIGWDERYGGLLLSVASDGGESAWPNWDKKLWWVHAEALYALTLAKEFSDASWIDQWYAKIHEYAFSHYPVPQYGEWINTLDRQGNKITDTIALPVKDPFHLPRALILAIESLERQVG